MLTLFCLIVYYCYEYYFLHVHVSYEYKNMKIMRKIMKNTYNNEGNVHLVSYKLFINYLQIDVQNMY